MWSLIRRQEASHLCETPGPPRLTAIRSGGCAQRRPAKNYFKTTALPGATGWSLSLRAYLSAKRVKP